MKEIIPVQLIDTTVEVPGSKSLTQRALIAAALAEGTSLLSGPLASEDTAYTMAALRIMGVRINDDDPACWQVHGTGGVILPPDEDIYLGNNGTATRFLTSVASLGHGTFHIVGSKRMAKRPIAPLMVSGGQPFSASLSMATPHPCKASIRGAMGRLAIRLLPTI